MHCIGVISTEGKIVYHVSHASSVSGGYLTGAFVGRAYSQYCLNRLATIILSTRAGRAPEKNRDILALLLFTNRVFLTLVVDLSLNWSVLMPSQSLGLGFNQKQ